MKYATNKLFAKKTKSILWMWCCFLICVSSYAQNFPETVIQDKGSGSPYATTQNAFSPQNSSGAGQSLNGQCTWYAYGRTLELVASGHLAYSARTKMENAFVGKYNRHAKNWDSMLSGTWRSTSSSPLPQQDRRPGMIVQWDYGTHGHVAFVEEVNSSKTMYRISEFNWYNNANYKDNQWLPFEGDDRRGTGVYPRFYSFDLGSNSGSSDPLATPYLYNPSSGAININIPVSFDWGSVSGATRYRIQVKKSSSSNGWTKENGFTSGLGTTSTVVLNATTNNSAFSWTDAEPNTTYWWTIRAGNDNAGSYYAEPRRFTSKSLTPSIPTGVNASDGSYSSYVRVTWNTTTNATHYKVYRSPANNTSDKTAIINWKTATTFNDYGATPGETYCYFVRAATNTYGANASGYSSCDNGHINQPTPSAPTNVNATDGIYNDKVRITWSSSTYATHYKVYRGISSNYNAANYFGEWQSNTYFDDYDATPGQIYYYWVRAATSSSGSNISWYSSSNQGHINLPTPSPATNVQATDGVHEDKVVITWNNPSNAPYFYVHRGLYNNEPSLLPLEGWKSGGNQFIDYTAEPGTTYYYSIKLSHSPSGDNASNYGNIDSGWRKLKTPTDLTASNNSYDAVTLTWNPIEGADGYVIYRDENSNANDHGTLYGWETSTTYTDNSAEAGKTYYYWIRASAGPVETRTGFSNVASGTRLENQRPTITITEPSNNSVYYYTRSNITITGTAQDTDGTIQTVQYQLNNGIWQNTPINNATWSQGLELAKGENTINVRAVDNKGEVSAIVSITAFYIAQPTNVQATDGDYTDKVVITWDAVPGTNSYLVFRNTVNFVDTAKVVGYWLSTTVYEDTAVQAGQEYYYWIKGWANQNGTNPDNVSNAEAGYAQAPNISLNLKAFLEGAYNITEGTMTTTLVDKQLIPTTQPFEVAPYCYDGTETLANVPSTMVDWVLVEVVKTDGTILTQKAAILLANGNIVSSIDTNQTIALGTISTIENYKIIIRHRNHMDVITPNAIQIIDNQLSYDFTANTSNDVKLKEISPNIFALYAGDANTDALISTQDLNIYQQNASLLGKYHVADFNLDGNMTTKDLNLYKSNASTIGASELKLDGNCD